MIASCEKISRVLYRAVWACALALFLPTPTLALDAKTDSMPDASHFEFLGSQSWEYTLQDSEAGFTLLLKALSPAAEKSLTEFRDDRIQSIEITHVPGDFPIQVHFHLTGPSLEAFDYLTDDPKRLVVDIFPKPQSAAAKVNSDRKPAGELPIRVAQVTPAPAAATPVEPVEASSLESASGPAVGAGLFDAADPGYSRFKVNPEQINSRTMVTESRKLFLELPIWSQPFSLLEELLEEKPVYRIHEKPGQENLEARFLLQVFEREHPAATIKAGEIFLRKYPRSDYRQIIEHILADTYFEHWIEKGNKSAFERSVGLYKDLVRKNPGSPLQERTELVMGLGYLKRGDGPSASRVLEKFKENFPESAYLPRIELALVHTDAKLGGYEKAAQRIKDIQNGDYPESVKLEATHMLGNVYLEQKKWDEAVQSYSAARERYPDGVKAFGYSTFNLGEAYFWQRKFLPSLDAFREYATYFPDTSHASYALTRVGEIFEILGQPEANSLAIFRESHFRYRDTDGGRLARIRFISKTMKDMADKDIGAALKEIAEISSQMSHPQADEFVELVQAEGYRLRGDYVKAADMLISFLAQNPRTDQRAKFEEGIVTNLALQMRKELTTGNPIEALRIYGKNSQLWFKNTDRLDPLYLASWAYEKAGAPEKAIQLYKDFEIKMNAIPAGEEKTDKMVIEGLPSAETLWLRQASVSCTLNDFAECEKILKKIENPKVLDDESYVELALLAATLLEKSGKSSEIARVLSTVEGRTEALDRPQTLLQLARAYAKVGQTATSANHYNKYLELAKTTGTGAKQMVVVHTELADLFLKNKQRDKAREILEKVIADYGANYDLSPERYNLGILHLEDGNRQAAREAWQPLVGMENNFWSKLAEDQIKDLKWQEEHSGVLNRLPASKSTN